MTSREDLWLRIYGSLELPAVIMQHSSGWTFGEVASPTNTLASPTWAPDIPMIDDHHRVEVTYPSLNSLQWGERPLLHTPFNASERYQPLPLVNDSEIQRNTGRDLKDQSPFFSMCRASLERPEEGVTLCGDIFKDIRELSTYIGVTRLNVLIYSTAESPRPMIRICSGTTFRQINNGPRSDGRRDYNLPLHEFLAVQNTSRWYQDILHLIEMRDDRAARHVQIRLQEYVESRETDYVAELYEKFAMSFKPKRQPYYDLYLYKDSLLAPGKAKSSSLFKTKKSCMICLKSLNTTTHIAVAFPCEHMAGRSCVRELCHSRQPEEVKCLKCDGPLFSPKALRHLRFGELDGKFENDPRFTEYENFEKSCVDLDRELPSRSRDNPNFTLLVNPSLFMAIWYRMVFFGSQEYSLLHVEAVNAPEFKILEATVDKHIQRLDGMKTTLKNLDWWLGLAIFQAFDVPFRAANLDRYTNRRLPASSREEVFFRPGFQRFAERALNRTLRFLEMRQCECHNETRLHPHGGRWYYNPSIYTNSWTQARSEIYSWQRTATGKAYLKEFRAKPHQSEEAVLPLLT